MLTLEVPIGAGRYRLGVRTRGSQPRDRGSIPRTATIHSYFPLRLKWRPPLAGPTSPALRGRPGRKKSGPAPCAPFCGLPCGFWGPRRLRTPQRRPPGGPGVAGGGPAGRPTGTGKRKNPTTAGLLPRGGPDGTPTNRGTHKKTKKKNGKKWGEKGGGGGRGGGGDRGGVGRGDELGGDAVSDAGLKDVQVQEYDGVAPGMWQPASWEARSFLNCASAGAPVVLGSAIPTGGSQILGGSLTAALVNAGYCRQAGRPVPRCEREDRGAAPAARRQRVLRRARTCPRVPAIFHDPRRRRGDHDRRADGQHVRARLRQMQAARAFNIGASDGLFLEGVINAATSVGAELRMQLSLDAFGARGSQKATT